MDEKDEIREMQRRYQLKEKLYKELEERVEIERKKWEKRFLIEMSNSVFIILKDDKGDSKPFILISTRKENGVLGKTMKVELKYLLKLGSEKGLKFTPWIDRIIVGAKPFFPYAPNQEYVTASPTFLLALNHGYIEDNIDPYNVKTAGFLFVNYPKYGNFLEAVSGSVVGNIAVIENLMKRNNEPYTRENHLMNWLYFFLSRECREISFQIFNMREKWVNSYSKYLQKFKTSFK